MAARKKITKAKGTVPKERVVQMKDAKYKIGEGGAYKRVKGSVGTAPRANRKATGTHDS